MLMHAERRLKLASRPACAQEVRQVSVRDALVVGVLQSRCHLSEDLCHLRRRLET